MGEACIAVAVPNAVEPDSWLNDEDYRSFRAAYVYASKQGSAIPALSKCSAEEIYSLFYSLKRGEEYYNRVRARAIEEAKQEYEATAEALVGESFQEDKPRKPGNPCKITLTERIPYWGYEAVRSDGEPWQLTDWALADYYELVEPS